jgi:hypothetical protein
MSGRVGGSADVTGAAASTELLPIRVDVWRSRKRRVRSSGRYRLREDSEHASSAEIQLDRELRLNEIVR